MNPTETADFSPILLLEVELSRPLEDVRLVHPKTGERYAQAQVLVRLFTSPIGYVHLDLPSGELDAESLAKMVWKELSAEITAHLKRSSLPVPDGLGVEGFSGLDAPLHLQQRAHLLQEAPMVSVVLTTHDRLESLEETLYSISAVHYPNFEIVVVDNAPSNDAAEKLIRQMSAEMKNLRYVREDRVGLCWARNCGLEAASGEITVYTDDDVLVDVDWLTALVQGFGDGENVACVTGLILPRELDTPAQVWCEEHGGFGKGFVPQIYDRSAHRPDDPLFP